jgi:zinc-ribbon domain
LKTCGNCGAQIADSAAFCQICGASEPNDTGRRGPSQQLALPKGIFYVLMVALALMGLVVVGLAVRGPTVITQTQTNYVTQMQFTTYTANFMSTSTETQAYTVTMASFTTPAAGPPPSWFNGQYCGYPFNPYTCNEGPPVTVNGYLTNDTACVNLYVGTGQTYVVWNLPQTEPDGAYQVYGFVYPNWPQTQPFPPYPFQKTLCIGIPMWTVPPYIQTA